MNSPADLLRYYYEMGYFRGRADAADGLPYDSRLPHLRREPERPDTDAIPRPSSADPSEQAESAEA